MPCLCGPSHCGQAGRARPRSCSLRPVTYCPRSFAWATTIWQWRSWIQLALRVHRIAVGWRRGDDQSRQNVARGDQTPPAEHGCGARTGRASQPPCSSCNRRIPIRPSFDGRAFGVAGSTAGERVEARRQLWPAYYDVGRLEWDDPDGRACCYCEALLLACRTRRWPSRVRVALSTDSTAAVRGVQPIESD